MADWCGQRCHLLCSKVRGHKPASDCGGGTRAENHRNDHRVMEETPWARHQENLPFTIAVLQLEKPCDMCCMRAGAPGSLTSGIENHESSARC